MFNFIGNRSIKTKLLVAFSVLIIIPISINSIVSYYRTVNFIEGKSISYARVVTQQINTTLDTYFKNMDKLSIQTAYSDSVQGWLARDYTSSSNPNYEYGLDLSSAYRFLDGMRKTAYGIDNIFVYNRSFKGYYGFITGSINNQYSIKDEAWYNKVSKSKGEKVLVGPYEEKQINISHGPVISLVRKIIDIKKSDAIGIIVIEVNLNDMFANHLKNIEQDSESNIFILNEEGKIIYNNISENEVNKNFDPEIFAGISNMKSGSFQEKFNGKASLITFDTSSFTNWKVVNIISRNELIKGIDNVRNNSISVGIVLIVVAFAFSLIISNGIVNPIRKLRKMIGKVEEGNFDQTIDVAQYDEIGMLSQSFNRMSRRLKELISQIYTKEEEKRKAEIVALQAQINPHFTYNTLGVIKQMAVIQKTQGISKMVDSLVNLLQASAKYKEEFITVEEELKLIKSYIYIQETRYCGKFIVNYDYDETALACKTLNLILQPIIENAIFHGINNKNGIGKISISVKIINSSLQYVIEDDGIGMSQEHIDKVFQEDKSSFERLGVYNVNKRIKLYFGDDYGVTIRSWLNEGTRVMITIPLIK